MSQIEWGYSTKTGAARFASIGGVIALAAWSAWPHLLGFEAPAQLALIWLIPFVWLMTSSRSAAFALVGFYYLVAWRDAPFAMDRFNSGANSMAAFALWAVYALVQAAIWTLAWSESFKHRCWGLMVVLVLTNIPPLAAFTAPSPLISAGWLFPHVGWLGILLTLFSWPLIALLVREFRDRLLNDGEFRYERKDVCSLVPLISAFMFVGASVLLNIRANERDLNVYPLSIQAMQTKMHRYPSKEMDHVKRQIDLVASANKALDEDTNLVVFPQSIAGTWQPNMSWMWHDLAKRKTSPESELLVGFDMNEKDGWTDSALLFSGKDVEETHARITAPLGAWHPWQPIGHMPMRWLDDGIIKTQGVDLAVLFGFEELTLWPWMVTAWNAHSDHVQAVVLANQWFAADLNSNHAQALSSFAMARIWGWGLVRSVNRPD